jgi:hypothetical protein
MVERGLDMFTCEYPFALKHEDWHLKCVPPVCYFSGRLVNCGVDLYIHIGVSHIGIHPAECMCEWLCVGMQV